jgi:DNA-binding transcriptional LysR family regulator
MPELRALEVLLTVASTGSFNAAATELGVSQQAVSARIASIESQLGLVLFARTTQGSMLTEPGHVVVEWASKLVEMARELDTGLGALRTRRQCELRIGASLTVAEHLLPSWFVLWRAGYQRRGKEAPDVKLTAVNTEAVITLVSSGDVDLGFIEGPKPPPGVSSRVVARDQLVVVVAPNHPWARRRAHVTAAELSRTALVGREPGSGTAQVLTQALQAALGADWRPRPPALTLSSTEAVRAAVQAGAGPAVLSEFAVQDSLLRGTLAQVVVDDLDLHRELRAIWLGDRARLSPPARDLLGCIQVKFSPSAEAVFVSPPSTNAKPVSASVG